MESTAVRCCYKVLRQGTMACNASVLHTARHCDKTLRQDTTPRQKKVLQQGNAAGAVLHTARHCEKTLRQDTMARQCGKRCGKTLQKALRLFMQQGTTAKHCGRHYGKKTPRQDNCDKNTLRQETMTWHCGKKLRHVTWHCGMALRLNRKKGGEGGAFTTS